MKYLKLEQGGSAKFAKVLCYKKFIVTSEGNLLCMNGNVVEEIVKKEDFAILENPTQTKRAHDFIRPLTVSPDLLQIVKKNKIPRTEVIKRLWQFIKDNKLQDSRNCRIINVGKNPFTKAVFKRDSVNMFEMNKFVSKHLS